MAKHDGYFKYIPCSEDQLKWGIHVTDCGWEKTVAGHPYPNEAHPEGYFFNAQVGRVLREAQIIYIPRGRGRFWSAASGKMNVKEGSLLLLFPNIRHHYAPIKSEGWDEYWVGFSGSYGAELLYEIFSPEKPVLSIGVNSALMNLFMEVSELAKHEAVGYRPIIAAKTLEIIARVHALSSGGRQRSLPHEQAIKELCSTMRQNPRDSIDFAVMAKETGMSYSSFRRLFKKSTGLAPNQYLLDVRIRKARLLLINTNLNICDVALECGFDNNFYFSKLFKSREGMSPKQFRLQH